MSERPTYLLWRANPGQPLPVVIAEGSALYRKKLGHEPKTVLCHPSRLVEHDPSAVPGLVVEPAPRLVWNPNEILIGD